MNLEGRKDSTEQNSIHADGSHSSTTAKEPSGLTCDAVVNQDESGIPEEEQCEQVNMNDENLDPLEWSIRKIIPIPKKYYFETGNYDVPFRTKAWHRSVQAMGLALHGVEKIGGFFASFLGLNSSRYDDVLAYMSKEELEQSRENARLDRERRKVRFQEDRQSKYKIEVV